MFYLKIIWKKHIINLNKIKLSIIICLKKKNRDNQNLKKMYNKRI